MFLRIWIFMVLINTGFAVMSTISGIDLCSNDPNFHCDKLLNTVSLGNFTTSGSTQINESGSTAGTLTNIPTQNGSNFFSDPFGYISQFTQLVAYATFIVINGFTGGYIFNVLTHIAVVPSTFNGFIMFQAGFMIMMVALFIMFLWYQLSGRFGSGPNI